MKRRHEERNVALREWKKDHLLRAEFLEIESRLGPASLQRKLGIDRLGQQVGRFRKRRGAGCGNQHCPTCHGDKYPKRKPTKQEITAAMRLAEQRQDFCRGG